MLTLQGYCLKAVACNVGVFSFSYKLVYKKRSQLKYVTKVFFLFMIFIASSVHHTLPLAVGIWDKTNDFNYILVGFLIQYIRPFVDNEEDLEEMELVSTKGSSASTRSSVRSKKIKFTEDQITSLISFDENKLLSPSPLEVSFPEIITQGKGEWQLKVHIHEGRDLIGSDISPCAEIKIIQDFGLSKSSNKTPSPGKTNNPMWQYPFCTTSKGNVVKDEFLDAIAEFTVSSGLIGSIGSCRFDLWTVYDRPGHYFVKKWVEIEDNKTSESRGFILISMAIFQHDQHNEEWNQVAIGGSHAEKVDISKHLLFPTDQDEDRCLYNVSIYEAVDLECSSPKIDPVFKVTYGSMTVCDITRKNSLKIMKQISFRDYYPPRFQTLKIHLCHKGYTSYDVVATYKINMKEISHFDQNEDVDCESTNFSCTFGPSWVYLYGCLNKSDERDKIIAGYGQGNTYQGKLLIEINSTEVFDLTTPEKSLADIRKGPEYCPTEKEFMLHATIFDASMINQKNQTKQLDFSISLGANGGRKGKGYPCSTNPYKVSTPVSATVDKKENRFCTIHFKQEKPIMQLTAKFPDLLERLRNRIQIKCIARQFEKDMRKTISNIENANNFKLDDPFKVLKKLLERLEKIESMIRVEGMPNANLLDDLLKRKRNKIRAVLQEKVKYILKSDKVSLEDWKQNMKDILCQMNSLCCEPQPSFPDIVILMHSNEKPVGYARIPVEDVVSLPGSESGFVRTVILRTLKSNKERYQDLIKAKLEIRLWMGYEFNKYLENLPSGYELGSPTSTRPFLYYKTPYRYLLRAYLYQGFTVLGSDESGLSDPFIRIIFGPHVAKTRIVEQTRSPVWNQMFSLDGIEMVQSPEELRKHPPRVLINVFDEDKNERIDEEFLGRTVATPIIIDDDTGRDTLTSQLEWLPISVGEKTYGEILVCFELYLEGSKHIPPLPKKITKKGDTYYPLPDYIRPQMTKYRIEILFWGVREMKRSDFGFSIRRPSIEAELGYQLNFLRHDKTFTQQDIIVSKSCANAKVNPNFPADVFIVDTTLPSKACFTPTITFKVYDKRQLTNTKILIGTNTSARISEYLHSSNEYHSYFKEEFQRKLTICGIQAEVAPRKDSTSSFFGYIFQSLQAKKVEIPKKTNKKRRIMNQLESDWWTIFYDSQSGVKQTDKKDEFDIPKIKIYHNELEKEFDNFSDFLTTFPIRTGKQDADVDQVRGKFKASIRVWNIDELDMKDKDTDPKGTFQKTPLNKPISLLVRVYCVSAKELYATDFDGKADPYLLVKLGDVELKSNHIENTLEPEFGKCFEFKAKLPFDNQLKIQVLDKNPLVDRIIGETYIDIENRFFSKHRATIGLSEHYQTEGSGKWRETSKPSEIYRDIYFRGHGRVPKFEVPEELTKENEEEEFYLQQLHNYKNHHDQAGCGYDLVPEHVETRPLYNQKISALPQGKLLMWVDIFNDDGKPIKPPVNIEPLTPKRYELRVIVWNCERIPLTENSRLLGTRTSDIRFQCWLEGHREKCKRTDIHYRSTDGSGMFNWRFKFPFKYHAAKKQIVRKQTAFNLDKTIVSHNPVLTIQCLEADLFSHDILGTLEINLLKIPPYYGKSSGWKIADFKKRSEKEAMPSLFNTAGTVRGWWPLEPASGLDADKGSRVELEIELVTKEEAEENPAGDRRDEPQALSKPKRPEESIQLFFGPLKTIRIFIKNNKWFIVKIIILVLILLLVVLFFYSLPGVVAKKVFGENN